MSIHFSSAHLAFRRKILPEILKSLITLNIRRLGDFPLLIRSKNFFVAQSKGKTAISQVSRKLTMVVFAWYQFCLGSRRNRRKAVSRMTMWSCKCSRRKLLKWGSVAQDLGHHFTSQSLSFPLCETRITEPPVWGGLRFK